MYNKNNNMSFDFDLGHNYPEKKDYSKKNLIKIGESVVAMLDISDEDLINDKKAYISIIRELKLKLVIDVVDGDR